MKTREDPPLARNADVKYSCCVFIENYLENDINVIAARVITILRSDCYHTTQPSVIQRILH